MCGGEGVSPQVTIVRRQLAVALWRRCVRFDLTGCLVVLPDRAGVGGWGWGVGKGSGSVPLWNKSEGWIGTEEKVESMCTACLLISCPLLKKICCPDETDLRKNCPTDMSSLHQLNSYARSGLRIESGMWTSELWLRGVSTTRELACGLFLLLTGCLSSVAACQHQLRPEAEPDCLKMGY